MNHKSVVKMYDVKQILVLFYASSYKEKPNKYLLNVFRADYKFKVNCTIWIYLYIFSITHLALR